MTSPVSANDVHSPVDWRLLLPVKTSAVSIALAWLLLLGYLMIRVPQLKSTFKAWDVELPESTVVVLELSNIVVYEWPVVLPLLAAGLAPFAFVDRLLIRDGLSRSRLAAILAGIGIPLGLLTFAVASADWYLLQVVTHYDGFSSTASPEGSIHV